MPNRPQKPDDITETAAPARPVSPAAAKAAQTALFAKLAAMFEPACKAVGKDLRPFSTATFTAMQLSGIAIGSEAFAGLSPLDQSRQLSALLVIQTSDLAELKEPLRKAAGDFETFYWDFVFERSAFPLDMFEQQDEQLQSNLPAIEAAQIEVQTPPSLKSGDGEKAPGN